MKTVFQQIIDRELPATILYEDDAYIIIDNTFPVAEIHYLVIPKKGIISIADATEEDKELIGGLMLLASRFAHEKGIKDYKLVFNAGKYVSVPHLHLHFLAGKLEEGDILNNT